MPFMQEKGHSKVLFITATAGNLAIIAPLKWSLRPMTLRHYFSVVLPLICDAWPWRI